MKNLKKNLIYGLIFAIFISGCFVWGYCESRDKPDFTNYVQVAFIPQPGVEIYAISPNGDRMAVSSAKVGEKKKVDDLVLQGKNGQIIHLTKKNYKDWSFIVKKDGKTKKVKL